jgi:hypothetical protein
VTLDIDGVGQVDVESVSLNADGTATITLSWATQSGDAGDYTATTASEDDTDSVTVTINAAALIWDAADLDSADATDDGVVHENTANTSYNNASLIRKGDATASPLFASNLSVWLPLQESSGSTAFDFSGADNDGSYVGATRGAGTALVGTDTPQLDGTDDYIEVPQFFSSPPSSYMVSGWMYWDRVQSGSRDVFWDFRDNIGSIARSGPSSQDLRVFHYDGSFSSATTITLSENEWYHIVLFYDGTDFVAMVDGIEEYRQSEGSPADAGRDNRIGVVSGGGAQFSEGSPSDVRVIAPCPSNPVSAAQDLYDIWASESSHETISKGPAPSSSPTVEFADVPVPGDSTAFVDVLEDTTGDGTADTVVDTISLVDGQTDYTASNVTEGEEIALRPRISSTSDLTDGATVEVNVEVTA